MIVSSGRMLNARFHIRVHALHRLGLMDYESTRAVVSDFDVKILLRDNLVPMLSQDKGFEGSNFYSNIPLWEKLYGVKLLGHVGPTSWKPGQA